MNRQILLTIIAATLAAHTLTGQTESETIKIKIAAEKAAQAARSDCIYHGPWDGADLCSAGTSACPLHSQEPDSDRTAKPHRGQGFGG